MTTNVAPVAPGEGNTNSSPSRAKRQNGGKKWCFTWNNYPEDWVALLAPGFQGSDWIGVPEVGESGTPHIQGYVEFPVKVRPIGYKGLPKEIHWESARGTKQENVAYCTKAGVTGKEGTLRVPRALPTISLTGWQVMLKTVFDSEPDNRTVYWVWSESGARGKSTMVRWMVRNGALICSGKASDMKYLIVKYHEKHGVFPDSIVFDVPRSMENFLSYTGIEEIKNGVFASTKYECDVVEMPYPHVFVFANFPPDMNNKDMSSDRFEVWDVEQ